MERKAATTQRVALVTGSSSGFGLLTAGLLAQKGYRVFGTSRQGHPPTPAGIEMLVLDVGSDRSVRACIARLLTLVDRIDVLINNAGQAHASLIEETDLEEARALFETNYWGVVRMTDAVLPIMRRQAAGHIINISSLAGLIGLPGQGFYSASKFALEGYSETLSLEVERFNIKVSLVEPGFFRTALHQSRARPTDRIVDYDDLRGAVESALTHAIAQGGDPEDVARAIVRIAGQRSPRLRYGLGREALWVPRMKALMPEWMFRPGLRRRFNLS